VLIRSSRATGLILYESLTRLAFHRLYIFLPRTTSITFPTFRIQNVLRLFTVHSLARVQFPSRVKHILTYLKNFFHFFSKMQNKC